MLIFRYFLIIMLALTALIAILVIAPEHAERDAVKAELDAENMRLEQRRQEVDDLARLKSGLQNNPRVIEKVARENWKYSREGELITTFRDSETP